MSNDAWKELLRALETMMRVKAREILDENARKLQQHKLNNGDGHERDISDPVL